MRPGDARARPQCSARARSPVPCHPVPTTAPMAIKPTPASTVHPRAPVTQPEHEFVGVCLENGMPATAQATTTVDRPSQPFSAPSDPWVSFSGPQWSSLSRGLNNTSPETLDQRRWTSTGCRRTWTELHGNHLSIPCAYSLLSIPWSSLCHLIEPYCCEQAGAHATDEPDRLRMRSDLFWPSPSMTCTSTWPPGPPGPHPALHRTSLAVGKPRHHFSSPRFLLRWGRSPGWKKEKRGGFCEVSDSGE
jgi:hypothetical protein